MSRHNQIARLGSFLRNPYLYFILYFTYVLIDPAYSISAANFFKGLIVLSVAYAPVYFFNDYADQHDDARQGKKNLYTVMANKRLFWSLAIGGVVTGAMATYLFSWHAVAVLIALYVLNYWYSFPPFRFRETNILRPINLFVINFVKLWLITYYLGYPLARIPIPVFVMSSALQVVGALVYKRKSEAMLWVFTCIGLSSLVWTWVAYPSLIIIFFPLLPGYLYILAKYARTQYEFGKLMRMQDLIALYIFAIFLIHYFVNKTP